MYICVCVYKKCQNQHLPAMTISSACLLSYLLQILHICICICMCLCATTSMLRFVRHVCLHSLQYVVRIAFIVHVYFECEFDCLFYIFVFSFCVSFVGSSLHVRLFSTLDYLNPFYKYPLLLLLRFYCSAQSFRCLMS